MKFDNSGNITKETFLSKISTKNVASKLIPEMLFIFKESFVKKYYFDKYFGKHFDSSVIAQKKLELVSRPHFFAEFFDTIFLFVILYKLVKFHHQPVFTSQIV